MFEVNLVPEVKEEMIKALKMRNLVLFICIAASIISGGLLLALFSIQGGQGIAMGQADERLELMSKKISSYSELDEFLTIQDQLSKISEISSNRDAASRVFDLLGVMLSQGQDKVLLSSLNIDLEGDELTLSMEGQADAGAEPYIDYRVLEAFKKNSTLITYDYGRYVDEKGEEIPAACVQERGDDGVRFVENGNYYGEWHKSDKGCDPQRDDYAEEDETSTSGSSAGTGTTDEDTANADENNENGENGGAEETEIVRIYRTPQFNKWYKNGNMTLDGKISGVEHFESVCTKYSGTESGKTVKWATENDCKVSELGVEVTESSNGMDENNNLVLRFNGSIEITQDVFAYSNKHMQIIPPSGQNVTDSYVQIGNMFTKPAEDCKKEDVNCQNAANAGGSE